MSKADKMFEELGYKKEEEQNIIYTQKFPNGEKWICFEKNSIAKSFFGVFEQAGDRMPLIFDMQELQAINEKCKELGWLDE